VILTWKKVLSNETALNLCLLAKRKFPLLMYFGFIMIKMFGTTYVQNNKTKIHSQMSNWHMKFVMTLVSSSISLRTKILSQSKQCYVSIKVSQWPSCHQLVCRSICSIKSSTFFLTISWYDYCIGCESMNRMKRHNTSAKR